MDVTEAFVSGSLGQAVYRDAGAFRILDGPDAEPRDAFPNEIQLFRHAAREVARANPEGLPIFDRAGKGTARRGSPLLRRA
jgi:hypothetical protein